MNNNESALFSKMGLANVDMGYIILIMLVLIIILLILLITQMVKTSKIKKRLDKFVLGKDGESLENEIISLYDNNKLLKNSVDQNRKDIRNLYKKLETTYQKMGLVKYDAFNQMGGQLSFSLALLDENNDGFIMNSVHSTDGCYSYTKEIKKGQSNITLGKEETEALEIAMGHS
ncbi:DUF4446 family protein [Lachnospiraceae bacterium OttesenSCG-928-D06]|nr:DUF4446 family protein [Lachnospiraceae bacterium OttesenSCG-928-D06]